MALPDDMPEIDLEIFEELGETFLCGPDSVSVVGIYSQDFLERQGGENFVEGYELSFVCRIPDLPELNQGDPILSARHGEFRFLRSEPDESGLTRVLLGR